MDSHSHWPSPTAITKGPSFCSCTQKQHHLKMFTDTGQTGAKRRGDSSTEGEQTFYCGTGWKPSVQLHVNLADIRIILPRTTVR